MSSLVLRSALLGAITLCGVGLLQTVPAQADIIQFNLTSNHCTVQADCGAPGTVFGTVTLTQNGTTVDVTVDLNNPPYAFAKTSSADDMMFKFNATDVLVNEITVDQVSGFTFAAQTGTFDGDGTGNFGFGIACTSCGGGLSSPFTGDLVFHVANATIADLTAPNDKGNVFVADVGNTTNGATGPIDATVPVPGPIVGAGLPGLIAACGGLLALARRRRRQLV